MKKQLYFFIRLSLTELTLGIILMLTALALIILAAFTTSNFNSVEVVLIMSAFILLGIGAHYMDSIEKINKARRRQFYGRLKIRY